MTTTKRLKQIGNVLTQIHWKSRAYTIAWWGGQEGRQWSNYVTRFWFLWALLSLCWTHHHETAFPLGSARWLQQLYFYIFWVQTLMCSEKKECLLSDSPGKYFYSMTLAQFGSCGQPRSGTGQGFTVYWLVGAQPHVHCST